LIEVGERTTQNEEKTIHLITHTIPIFHIMIDMFHLEESMVKKPLKDFVDVYLVLDKIPTKALYNMQASVTKEVQSLFGVDVTELQVARDGKEALQIVVEQAKMET